MSKQKIWNTNLILWIEFWTWHVDLGSRRLSDRWRARLTASLVTTEKRVQDWRIGCRSRTVTMDGMEREDLQTWRIQPTHLVISWELRASRYGVGGFLNCMSIWVRCLSQISTNYKEEASKWVLDHRPSSCLHMEGLHRGINDFNQGNAQSLRQRT